MKIYISTCLLLIAVLLGLVAAADPGAEVPFRLKSLGGRWEGTGEVVIPKTSIPISIDGQAEFVYDSISGKLRTQLTAKRFFFTYADSGYLTHDTTTDSINWEIWDGFGKHAIYDGKVESGIITGSRLSGEKQYRVVIDIVTPDSITFLLTTTHQNGDIRRRAAIDLWRSE